MGNVVVPEAAFHWAGYAGAAFYLGAYAGLQAGILRGSSYAYTVLNLVAASLVLVSLYNAFNAASAMIQISWIVISVAGLTRQAILRHRVRFSAEERAMLDKTFPDMPRPMARRFLDRGNWIDVGAGADLTREREPVRNLIFIAEGTARAFSGGVHIGEIHGGFVGEMNVLDEGPASATVTTAGPCRVFAISSAALRQACRRDSDFRLLLENSLSRDTGRKLKAANLRLSEGSARGQAGRR